MKTQNQISRRTFSKLSVAGSGALLLSQAQASTGASHPIFLGGPVMEKYDSPEEWIAILKRLGYRAAYCPVNADAGDDVISAYETAAKNAGVIIAETGAWSNPIDPDSEKAKKALEKCKTQLALAERIGARCCVNISGSKNPESWHGPHESDLTQETFDAIVEVTRKTIDAVKPKRTYFTLETMPWAYPDSPDSYLRLIEAIDRKGFAAHLDPVNLVSSPQRYFRNGEMIRECFEKFGAHIQSCHAKDIFLSNRLTTHLDEVIPGAGNLNYRVFLQELSKLSEVPLMLEHLKDAAEYKQAADTLRSVGNKAGVKFA